MSLGDIPENNEPRGGKTNDFNKIRILHILETHITGCQQKSFRKPPGGSELPKYLEVIKDLKEDKLIKIDHDDEYGEPILVISKKGKKFLNSFIVFSKKYPEKFYMFRILDEDTSFPSERSTI